ncbi:hypothetical protein COR50_19670 [Chitinophaga caeni]|uniref:RagB/SusD family nutrient uptake outer membrane protein n=1 Tax=Chitinophaga caeni TaxID=2029983 RepID=A0A291QZE4_9BACT|nr:RagB/SusD family nutrient uptake outer membrane protein [Chitinophaga caeni]ATL49214.1 hypothetical protein COR50_19670 [Chitinophaga caeni]
MLRYKNHSKLFISLCLTGILFYGSSCSKLIEVDPPAGSITTEKVFESDVKAYSAIAAAYSKMMYNSHQINATNGGITLYTGILSDEMESRVSANDPEYSELQNNKILKTNSIVSSIFWASLYESVYISNSILNGIESSSSPALSDECRRLVTGEAKFIRAFSYFYLVNLFGDIPLPLSYDANKTIQLTRSPVADVYKQIEHDLSDACQLLPTDYSQFGGEKVRANRWAALALMARVKLYEEKWEEAKLYADTVINEGNFQLVTPDKAFLANNDGVILQFKNYEGTSYLMSEPDLSVPLIRLSQLSPADVAVFTDPSVFPIYFGYGYYLNDFTYRNEIIDQFDITDKRRATWIDSVPCPNIEPYNGRVYYYSVKYRGLLNVSKPDLYYMVLRLSEQYLVRAEAKLHLNDIDGALNDINAVREKAGLAGLHDLDENTAMQALQNENLFEFIGEWGHRWFDLKRWGKTESVLSTIENKKPWSNHSLLMPIPDDELIRSPQLTQNPDY